MNKISNTPDVADRRVAHTSVSVGGAQRRAFGTKTWGSVTPTIVRRSVYSCGSWSGSAVSATSIYFAS